MRSGTERQGRTLVTTRGGVTSFFLVGGIGFVILGAAMLLLLGGLGGSITGGTFLMIGTIWTLVALGIQGLYSRMNRQALEEQRLFETGQRGVAVVEGVETTGTVLNRVNQQIVLRLRIQPRSGAEFVHERKLFVPFHGIPRTGDLIDVAFDPLDRSRVALATDWRSNTRGGRLLMVRQPEQPDAPSAGAASGGASYPFRAGAAAGATDGVIEQLERLGRLRETGVLTQAEFEAQKARVLSGQRS